jgi:hypothetical protein
MQLQRYPPKVDTLNLWILASQYQGDQAPLEIDYAASHLGAYWSNAGRLLNPDAYNYGFYALPYPVRIYQDRLLGIIPAGEKAAANNGCFNYLVSDTKAPRSTGEYNETTSRAERVSTHWRLIWKDLRYKDASIPDESEYFLEQEMSLPATATHDPVEDRTGESPDRA